MTRNQAVCPTCGGPAYPESLALLSKVATQMARDLAILAVAGHGTSEGLRKFVELGVVEVEEGERPDFFLQRLRELEDEVNRRDVVLDWLAENSPAALELCPYKVVRGATL